MSEVEKRENQENQLAELQAKLKAALNERKMMSQIRSSMDEVEAELSNLRAQNRDLQDKLSSLQKRLSAEKSGPTQDQVDNLRRENDEHQTRYQKKCGELDAQLSKAKELNSRVVEAEKRANEYQKKYDECKRNYFKLREERERLRNDLEKVRGGSAASKAEDGAAGDA